jgi:hypothetical protein
VFICATLITLLGVSSLEAQDRKENLTSKIYMADVSGITQIESGETIADVTKKSVYAAQGAVIETKEEATNAMVLSNGTGIFCDSSTRLEVRKFVQEPFTPNRNDMETEPSISTTETFLSRGSVGLCTSKPVAGSSMTYNTPQASVRIKGRKSVIDVTSEGTKVSLLEGAITVQAGSRDAGGQTLNQGQQALISPAGAIRIQNIPASEISSLNEKVSMACLARRTVYFDVKGQSGSTGFDAEADTNEIVAVEVTPPAVAPEVTVSAASIPRSN